MADDLEGLPPFTDINLRDYPSPHRHLNVVIRADGAVVWINVGPSCLFRVCGATGVSVLDDSAEKR